MTAIESRYGRLLSDFEVGATYEHPWEVTVDGGTVALFQASFLDATPIYCVGASFAQSVRLAGSAAASPALPEPRRSRSRCTTSPSRPSRTSPTSTCAFPRPGYAGDTVRARSTVLGVKPASSGDKGVVHVRTILENEHGARACARSSARRSFAPASSASARPGRAVSGAATPRRRVVPVGADARSSTSAPRGFGPLRERLHGRARCSRTPSARPSASRSTCSSRRWCATRTRCTSTRSTARTTRSPSSASSTAGWCLSWVATLASRDLGGHALWEAGLDDGAHPNGVVGGDTLYAASKVLARRRRRR